jgi:hypothetical protein
MPFSDALDLRGQLTIHKIDRHQQIVAVVTAHNDITLAGRKLVASLFNKETAKATSPVNCIVVGQGTGEFSAGMTSLYEEVDRIENLKIAPPEIAKNNRIKLMVTGTLEENDDHVNGKILTEAGLYRSDQEPNILYNRVQFEPIKKTSDFKLTLIWEIFF